MQRTSAAGDRGVPRLTAELAGVLLAGAHVWNEDSLEYFCPRGALPVANRPLIRYQLRWLREAGIDLVVICTNDRPGELLAVVEQSAGDADAHSPRLFFLEDAVPRGPAGCARDVADLVAAGQYLVLDGSILPTFDLPGLLERHRGRRSDATVAMCCSAAEGSSRGPRCAPAGVYVFERAALSWVGPSGYQDLKETLLPRLHNEGAGVLGYEVNAPPQRIDGLASYLAVQAWGVQQRAHDRAGSADHRWQDGVAVHGTARVAPSATLIGPLIIGPDCRIDAHAIIVGPAALGSGCRLHESAVVAQSVLWDFVHVKAEARVHESVLTTGATVEGGRDCVAEIIAPGPDAMGGIRRVRRHTGR